jgi:hypothetical protein
LQEHNVTVKQSSGFARKGNTMEINFKDLEVKDIEGEVIPDNTIYKAVADILYKFAGNLDFVSVAMEMNKGIAVDLTIKQLREIVKLIKSDKSNLFAYAKKAVEDFVEAKIKEYE